MTTERLTVEQVLALLNDAPARSTLVQRNRSGNHMYAIMHKHSDGWHMQAHHEVTAVYANVISDEELTVFANETVYVPDPIPCDYLILTPDLYAQAVMIPGVDAEAEHD